MNTLSIEEVRETVDRLGPTLTAFAAGCSSNNTPMNWTIGRLTPSNDEMERLVVIKAVLDTVAKRDSIDVARQWFIGANCDNMVTSPAEVIREGRYDEARLSAKRMATDSFY